MISIKLLRHVADEESANHFIGRESIGRLRIVGKPKKKLIALEKWGFAEERDEPFAFVGGGGMINTKTVRVTDRGHTLIRVASSLRSPISKVLVGALSIVLAWLVLMYIFGVGK